MGKLLLIRIIFYKYILYASYINKPAFYSYRYILMQFVIHVTNKPYKPVFKNKLYLGNWLNTIYISTRQYLPYQI